MPHQWQNEIIHIHKVWISRVPTSVLYERYWQQICSIICLVVVCFGFQREQKKELMGLAKTFTHENPSFLQFLLLWRLSLLETLKICNEINNSYFRRSKPWQSHLAPQNHARSGNSLLIVSQGNWSKLICDFKGSRHLKKKICKIITYKQNFAVFIFVFFIISPFSRSKRSTKSTAYSPWVVLNGLIGFCFDWHEMRVRER